MRHIVTGAPCSGKSTYVEEHAKTGDLIVDLDKIAQAFGGKSREYDGIIKDTAIKARAVAVETARTSDAESWICDTYGKCAEDDDDVITIDPGKDECIRRAKEDGRPDWTLDLINEWYSKQKRGLAMEHKQKDFKIKSADESGTISGYFSTYDRIPDSYGDVIAPGAFTETIKAREESGHPFPLCWNHSLDQIIGAVDKIEDDEHGPLMTAHFFDTELAQEKRKLVQEGVVYQFSFAYDVKDSKTVTLDDGTKANELRDLNLFEVSIVPIPANPRAEVTEIKSGRRNRKSDEDTIKQIISLAQSLLDAQDEPEPESEGEDEPEVNAEAEEPKASNPEKDALINYIKKMED